MVPWGPPQRTALPHTAATAAARHVAHPWRLAAAWRWSRWTGWLPPAAMAVAVLLLLVVVRVALALALVQVLVRAALVH